MARPRRPSSGTCVAKTEKSARLSLSHAAPKESPLLIINRFRLRTFENLLKARIASQRIPLPTKTQVREHKARWCQKKPFDERDRLIGVTSTGVNLSQIIRIIQPGYGIFAFWDEFHSPTTRTDGILFSAQVGVEFSEGSKKFGVAGMIGDPEFEDRYRLLKQALCPRAVAPR